MMGQLIGWLRRQDQTLVAFEDNMKIEHNKWLQMEIRKERDVEYRFIHSDAS